VKPLERRRFPTTAAQEAIWLSNRISAAGHRHNLLWQVSFQGALRVERLARALQGILDRHEALRASFSLQPEGLVQIIDPPFPIDLAREDLSGWPAAEGSQRLNGRIREMGVTGFEPEHGPLVRFHLLRLGAEEHRLLVAMHHLVTDGGSWPLLVEELIAFYQGAEPAPLAMQYGDHAEWQKQMLASGAWRSDETFWHKLLDGMPELPRLPADRPRGQRDGLLGKVQEQLLPPQLAGALKELGRRHGASLFRTLLSAFAVLLHRFTGAEDLVVGTTLTGRGRGEVARLIGCLINPVVLRIWLDGEPAFGEVLRQVDRQLGEAVQRQDYPFDRMARLLGQGHAAPHGPFSSVSFTKLPKPIERQAGLLSITEQRLFLDAPLNELSVYAQERRDAIALVFLRPTVSLDT